MSPRGRPRGQGRPQGLHLCYLSKTINAYTCMRKKDSLLWRG